MEIKAVQASYARWAPIYDHTFGAVTRVGRRRVAKFVNTNARHATDTPHEVLEVGVGTGLSLPLLNGNVEVTGIDFSTDMLKKAKKRVTELALTKVRALQQMDARSLAFPDNSFDTVMALHVLSVVPEPERVMAEIARVCKPGGTVVITNHFAREKGAMAFLAKAVAPLENLIGWHSDFEIGTILQETTLSVEDRSTLPPLGMMTFLVLRKADDS